MYYNPHINFIQFTLEFNMETKTVTMKIIIVLLDGTYINREVDSTTERDQSSIHNTEC